MPEKQEPQVQEADQGSELNFKTFEEVRNWYRGRYPGQLLREDLVRQMCVNFRVQYEAPVQESDLVNGAHDLLPPVQEDVAETREPAIEETKTEDCPGPGETTEKPVKEKKARAKKPAAEKPAAPVQENAAAVQEVTGDPLADAVAKIRKEMTGAYSKVIGDFLLQHLEAHADRDRYRGAVSGLIGKMPEKL
jgi:hypothetical protein